MRILEALAAATIALALAVARAAAATAAAAAAADPARSQILCTFQLPTAEYYSVPFCTILILGGGGVRFQRVIVL